MPGQFKTRRGAGGRVESIPEAEQISLIAGSRRSDAESNLAASEQQRRDAAFLQEQRGAEPPPLLPAEPPPLPGSPPPLPKAPPAGIGLGGAAAGGAAVLAGYALKTTYEEQKQSPIGSPDRGTVRGGGNRDLEELLEVTKKISRVGSPIKGAVKTQAAGSRV